MRHHHQDTTMPQNCLGTNQQHLFPQRVWLQLPLLSPNLKVTRPIRLETHQFLVVQQVVYVQPSDPAGQLMHCNRCNTQVCLYSPNILSKNYNGILRFWLTHEHTMAHFHCYAAFFVQSLDGLFAWLHYGKIIIAHDATQELQLLPKIVIYKHNRKFIWHTVYIHLINRSFAQNVRFLKLRFLLVFIQIHEWPQMTFEMKTILVIPKYVVIF